MNAPLTPGARAVLTDAVANHGRVHLDGSSRWRVGRKLADEDFGTFDDGAFEINPAGRARLASAPPALTDTQWAFLAWLSTFGDAGHVVPGRQDRTASAVRKHLLIEAAPLQPGQVVAGERVTKTGLALLAARHPATPQTTTNEGGQR